MASRMDKYHSRQTDSTGSVQSRLSKNENLYEELYTNKVFTEFTNANFDNIIELDNFSNFDSNGANNRREQYQKSRILSSDNEVTKKSNSFSYLYDEKNDVDKREKNYNINDVLENARKNRTEEDELEKRRRLKSVEYSILSDLSQEKLKEYHDNKQKKLTKDEEENLEELIHTITSNSLRKKIDDELLSDLLPTEESETLVSSDLLEQLESIEEKNNEIKEDLEDENKIDDSFYTKSMELSKQDFELDDEDYSFLDDNHFGFLPKLLIFLLILVVIGIIIYVICRFI